MLPGQWGSFDYYTFSGFLKPNHLFSSLDPQAATRLTQIVPKIPRLLFSSSQPSVEASFLSRMDPTLSAFRGFDPSQELDEHVWAYATEVSSGVYGQKSNTEDVINPVS
ncbi:hypothetical protein KAF25_001913 [Fusarium avenaceum]|uniref:Uncharacterized protein n=1 Tax=Fusarium avenaceum TaxID=40199 RepID=A0A9P7KNR2_9HYPO|nr:hypothetical protein KAF25_001913 [Fusarium avenaceum]